jgi:hypothetical protein
MAVLTALAMMFAGTAGVAAQDATPSAATFQDTMGLPELSATVSDTAIEGLPAETPAGRYVLTVNVTAADGGGVEFLQLPEGMTLDDFVAALGGPPASPEADMASPEMGASPPAEGGGPPPEWLYTTKLAGGAAGGPGQTSQAIIDLTPGNWIAWQGYPEAPQPPVALTVTGDAVATPAAAEPPADITVTMFEYGFKVEGTLTPGSHTIKVMNVGAQPHFVSLLRSPGPVTRDQIGALLEMEMTGGTPAPGSDIPNPEEFVDVAYSGTMSTNVADWIPVNLEPGYYIMVCFVPDIASGAPHAFEGMYDVFEVTG